MDDKLYRENVSTLLNYLGSKTTAHATSILSLALILFSGIQASNIVFGSNPFALSLVFSIVSSAVLWQYWRLIYYSNLSSYVTILDPRKLRRKCTKSKGHAINMIRRIQDAADEEIEIDHPRLHQYFHTSGKQTFLVCFLFGVITFSTCVTWIHVFPTLTNFSNVRIDFSGLQLTLLEMFWLCLAIVGLFLTCYLIRRLMRPRIRCESENQANELMKSSRSRMEEGDYYTALLRLTEVIVFAKKEKKTELLKQALELINSLEKDNQQTSTQAMLG